MDSLRALYKNNNIVTDLCKLTIMYLNSHVTDVLTSTTYTSTHIQSKYNVMYTHGRDRVAVNFGFGKKCTVSFDF